MGELGWGSSESDFQDWPVLPCKSLASLDCSTQERGMGTRAGDHLL